MAYVSFPFSDVYHEIIFPQVTKHDENTPITWCGQEWSKTQVSTRFGITRDLIFSDHPISGKSICQRCQRIKDNHDGKQPIPAIGYGRYLNYLADG
jgi:hypothetical protein